MTPLAAMITRSAFLGAFALSLIANAVFFADRVPARTAAQSDVIVEFNEKQIDAWRRSFDFSDAEAIFELVLSRIGEAAFVYPTENYYYFRLHAAGRTIGGNINLDARDRDQGKVHFTYYDVPGNHEAAEQFTSKDYSSEQGVQVLKIEDFLYTVRFRGQSVRFRLNQQKTDRPAGLKLASAEVFVGPVFDESGISFALIFDTATNHFMYLLNELPPPMESFLPYRASVVVGERTGFAFYEDTRLGRKILIGVDEVNRNSNNYYDGPFDQMPDNHVDAIGLQKFIKLAYRKPGNETDKYGSLLDDKETRIAISPYIAYRDRSDFDFIDGCANTPESNFYRCLTPDPREQR
jgi:hypothetical protein